MMDYYKITAAISGLSVLANLLLVFISFRFSSRNSDSYRYFLFFTALQDLIFSICFVLIAPKPSTREFAFVFLCTGPMGIWPYGMIAFVFFCITTISTVLFVANNFLYRYIKLCKNRFAFIYTSKKYLAVVVFVDSLLILNWMCMIYFSLWPYDEFLSISKEVWPDGTVNVTGRSYIAISNRNGADPLKMAILIESLVMLLSVAQISPFCAMRIHRCLKENSFSSRTKALHGQMLILLSIQTICPTLLMHLPLSSMYVLLFSGATSPPVMSYSIGILMALNPLFGPIVTIAFVKEYRRCLLASLRIIEPTSVQSTGAIARVTGATAIAPVKRTF